MKSLVARLKRLIKKVIKKVKEFFKDEYKDIKNEIKEEEARLEYAQRVVDKFENGKMKVGVKNFSQKDVQTFRHERVAATVISNELREEIQRRDGILRSFLSSLSESIKAMSNDIWETSSSLPKILFESIRKNIYKLLKESGEEMIIKPSINPDKFIGKYCGEGKDYTSLFNETELSFMSLSLYNDNIDIKERAESLIWFYNKDADLNNNMYLSRLRHCDPVRVIDLRSVYYDLFNEIWDNEKSQMIKKPVVALAEASDRFFEECTFRRKMERIYGESWFKEAYGLEYFN